MTGAPADAASLEVTFDGTTWTPMMWSSDKTTAKVLVAGPDMPTPTGIVLPLGRKTPKVRLVDAPETIIRPTGGSIDVS